MRYLVVAGMVAFAARPEAAALERAATPSPIEAAASKDEPAPAAVDFAGDVEPQTPFEVVSTTKRPHKRVHLKNKDVTPAIRALAYRYLDSPMGSETLRMVEGKRYSFCVEPHYHAPGSGFTPEGWHKGVTVYGVEEQ